MDYDNLNIAIMTLMEQYGGFVMDIDHAINVTADLAPLVCKLVEAGHMAFEEEGMAVSEDGQEHLADFFNFHKPTMN